MRQYAVFIVLLKEIALNRIDSRSFAKSCIVLQSSALPRSVWGVEHHNKRRIQLKASMRVAFLT